MSQTFTDDCYAAGHQATTDLQAFENNFAALKSAFSGTSAPSNIVAGMAWLDTTLSLLKTRNTANDAWNIILNVVATGITAGDTVYASAANVLSLLAKGTAYQSLNMNSGATAPQWQASLQSLMTAAGDIVVASAANAPAVLHIGTAGQLINVNSGANGLEYINGLVLPDVTAGTTTTLASAITESPISSTSYTKQKECKIGRRGIVTVVFTLNSQAGTFYGKIYVNGSAVGTERTSSDYGDTTYSENITVAQGDLVQLYVKKGASGGTAVSCKDFYVKCTDITDSYTTLDT